jgi:hypothetical protein
VDTGSDDADDQSHLDLGDFVVFSPNSEDRISDQNVHYCLSLSFGRVVAVEGGWPPTKKSTLKVHWLYSDDPAETPWRSVKFTEWEIEEEVQHGRKLLHHYDRIALEQFVHVDSKILVVSFSRKKSYLQLTFESSTVLEQRCDPILV